MSMYDKDLDKNSANYEPLSPISFLSRTRRVYPQKKAISYGKIQRSYKEAGNRCDLLANALISIGILTKDTVAVMLPNIPEMWECHFGVPMAGAVLNSINTRLEASTISFILKHGEAKLFLYDSEYSDRVSEAIKDLDKPPILIEVVDQVSGQIKSELSKKLNIINYEEFILNNSISDFSKVLPSNEWDPIALNYTSGTTGNPKGVVCHHRGAYLNAIGNTLTWDIKMHPNYLWTLPMFHCNGWCFPWTITERAGIHVCLRQPTGAGIIESINHNKVTHLCGAPIIMQMIAENINNSDPNISRNLKMMTAGAPPPEAVLSKMADCEIEVTHTYGLTEVYGPAVVCAWQDEWNNFTKSDQAIKKSRQGVTYPVQEDLIVVNPETMKQVKKDGTEMGEVLLRGNITMSGYLKNPKATKEVFENGWFHTGDLGVWYEDGYIQLKDRSKDIIISGGENISSIEIEGILYKHPYVSAAAVVAKDDLKWGETPCAFIELREGIEENKEDLINHCRQHLAGFKVPKHYVFCEIPKTSTGKIQKFLLRKQAENI